MTGAEFKNKLRKRGVVFADLAAKLEMSQQNLMGAFQVKDVKTGFVERVAEVLGVPFVSFFIEEAPELHIENVVHHVGGHSNVAAGAGASAGASNDLVDKLMAELSALRKQNERLVELLAAK